MLQLGMPETPPLKGLVSRAPCSHSGDIFRFPKVGMTAFSQLLLAARPSSCAKFLAWLPPELFSVPVLLT